MAQLLKWLVTVLGLVLAVLWLLLVTVITTATVPGWLPPAAMVCVAVAVTLP